MKLVSLNIWGGKVFEPLIKFTSDQSKDTDIFCLQEVFDTSSNHKTDGETRVNILSELKNVLTDFAPYFVVAQERFNFLTKKYVDYNLSVGMAIFIRKNLPVISYKAPFIYNTKNGLIPEDMSTFPKIQQALSFTNLNDHYTIFNIHGVWFPNGFYGDNEPRIDYYKRVKAALDRTPGKKILCGDFNLDPDTKSLQMLETGMKNLVKECSIVTTRSSLYNWPRGELIDYILVSPEIKVSSFEVPNVTISDHLPLILEFS